MTEPVSTFKTLVGTFTAAVIAPATADALRDAERIILGAPQSVLLVAIAGSLIGVLLLPEKDADRVAADAGRARGHRWAQMGVRLLALAVAVLGYAFIAAWLVDLASSVFQSLAAAPKLPLAGICGVSIRRLLPAYLRAVERVTGGSKP